MWRHIVYTTGIPIRIWTNIQINHSEKRDDDDRDDDDDDAADDAMRFMPIQRCGGAALPSLPFRHALHSRVLWFAHIKSHTPYDTL